MPQRLDRLLVLALAALVAVVAWTGLRGGGGSQPAPPPARAAAARPPAPVPRLVQLHPSSTSYLPRCPVGDLQLALARGGTLVLRFAGGRCHLPPLHLRVVERDAAGRVVYRGPALRYEALSGNFAGSGVRRARLVRAAGAATAVVAGSGLSASGRL
ncbi:MAG TPA: hypothetical protein VFJ91_01750 [Gaiellaceae bacterium]|nr:hypothetical protein [Gaiellaceae bacterium]